MKIAVCDDIPEHTHKIKKLLTDYFTEKRRTDTEILLFNSALKLLETFAPNKYDILFLDIDMPELNGMELAKKIRLVDTNVPIVFITHMENMLPAGYEVMASGFIVKPPAYTALKSVMDRIAFYNNKKQNEIYKIHVKGGGTKLLLLSEIIYIESIRHYLIASTCENTFSFLKNISEIEKELASKDFVRIHKSYLANMSYFWIFKDNYIILTNGEELPIGRKYLNTTKETYRIFKRSEC